MSKDRSKHNRCHNVGSTLNFGSSNTTTITLLRRKSNSIKDNRFSNCHNSRWFYCTTTAGCRQSVILLMFFKNNTINLPTSPSAGDEVVAIFNMVV